MPPVGYGADEPGVMGETGVDLLIVPLEPGTEDVPPVGYGTEEIGFDEVMPVEIGPLGVDEGPVP